MTLIGVCMPIAFCYLTSLDSDVGMYDVYSTMYIMEKELELYLAKLNYQQRYLELLLSRDLRKTMDDELFIPLNSALTRIKGRVDNLTENAGSNECYSNANTAIYTRTLEEFDYSVPKCLTELRDIHLQEVSDIKHMIERVQNALDNVLDVMFSCNYYGKLMDKLREKEAKECIYGKLETSRKEVRRIKKEIDSMDILEPSSYAKEMETFKECVKPIGSILNKYSTSVESGANFCIKYAEKD